MNMWCWLIYYIMLIDQEGELDLDIAVEIFFTKLYEHLHPFQYQIPTFDRNDYQEEPFLVIDSDFEDLDECILINETFWQDDNPSFGENFEVRGNGETTKEFYPAKSEEPW